MKRGMGFFGVLFLCWTQVAFSTQSIDGLWTTMDDATGKRRAIVRLEVSDGVLNGTIVSVVPQAGDVGKCSKCPGTLKDKPIKGLRFIWGLKEKGYGEWSGGEILDPKTGKIYRAKLMLKGNKLYVRGYLGVSLLGRTQIWTR